MGWQEEKKRYHREYMRKWRATNKERVRQYNENFWRKKAELNQDTIDTMSGSVVVECRSLEQCERELLELKRKI